MNLPLEGEDGIRWLEGQCGKPTLLPELPSSRRLALVAVTVVGDGDPKFTLVTDQESLDAVARPVEGRRVIFFSALKSELDGLAAEGEA